MIIPTIRFSADADTEQLVEQLKHWSLFGKVALKGVAADQAANLEFVIKRVGGFADLLIEFEQPNEQDALAVLNAGATSILCQHAISDFEAIPEERIVFFKNDDSLDEAIPKDHVLVLAEPSADRIAELEMARVDCLVDIDSLTPKLVTEFFKTVLVTDRSDGLWSTVIVDPMGVALGLAYSNEESLFHAIENRVGTYWSRSRD